MFIVFFSYFFYTMKNICYSIAAWYEIERKVFLHPSVEPRNNALLNNMVWIFLLAEFSIEQGKFLVIVTK